MLPTLSEQVDRFVSNEPRLDSIINGGVGEYITLSSGARIPSLPTLFETTTDRLNDIRDGKDATELSRRANFIAIDGQTEFDPGFAYQGGLVSLFINGVLQPQTEYTAPGGTSPIVLNLGCSAADEVSIYFLLPSNAMAGAVSISPYMFGCVGDGIADDTDGMLALAGYCNRQSRPVKVDMGSGIYRILRPVVWLKQVSFCGARAVFLINGPNAQTQFMISTDEDYTGAQQLFSGISWVTSAVYAIAPLHVECAATNVGTAIQVAFIDCEWRGANGYCGFPFAANFINISYPTFERCRVQGDRSNNPLKSSGFNFVAQAGFDKGDIDISRCYFFFLRKMATIRGHQEGVKISRTTAVACLDGIDWQADGDQVEPLLQFTMNHINIEQNAIILRGIVQFDISGNSFYGQAVQATATESHFIDAASRNGPALQGTILRNCFFHSGASAARKIAIFLQGNVDGTMTNVVIDANQFQGSTFGIYLDASSSFTRIGLMNVFESCDTNIFNASANNNAQTLMDRDGNIGIGGANPDIAFGLNSKKAIQAENFAFKNGVAFFSGEGVPDGVIAAPPGSFYSQTSATQDGHLWWKQTGSSITGWKVLV